MKKLKNFFSSIYFVYLLVIIFVVIFSLLSFGRHDLLESYLNDLGTYDQVIWNTLHGRFFEMTVGMLNENNYLGAHFSPILLFFVPFYTIFATPKWLLFFQALAVGIGSVPIYLFAKEKLKSSGAGLVFLTSFLLYPVLQNAILYDFHEVVLAVPFASFAFYFLEKRNDKWFIIFSILLALCQEHLVLLVFMMGLYACFIQRRWKFGSIVSLFSLGYFFLIMLAIMPFFSKTGNSALIANNSSYPSRYAWLGSSFSGIIKQVISHPIGVFLIIFNPERIRFLFTLLLPVLSFGIFSAPFFIAIPIFIINFLSSNNMTYSIYFYHSAVVVPFIFFASIVTFKKWFLDDIFIKRIFLILIMVISLGTSVKYTITPLSPNYHLKDYFPDSHARKINEIEKIIPKESSISIQHNLGPHFSERKNLYRFPLKIEDSDYVLLDQTDPYRNNPEQVFEFDYALQMGIDEWQQKIKELKESNDFELIYDEDGYLLFKSKVKN